MKLIKIFIVFLLTATIVGCSEDTIDNVGTGSISGVVVESGSNEPVENARISTNPASSTVFTNEKGEFILEDIPAQDYSVEARKDGLLTQFEGATVPAGGSVSVVFELRPETANNKQPLAPEAVSPKDNATGVAVTTDFVWTVTDPEDDDLVFTLEIRNDSNQEVLRYTGITDTTYTVEGLDFNKRYFWQVSASDDINPEVKSSIFAFTTMDVPQSRVLFTRTLNGNNVIFALDEEGNEFQLTSSSHNSYRPRKNNSRNKIAYLRTVAGETHIFTMDPNGANQQQITFNVPVRGADMNKVDFTWAEDGSILLYPNFDKLYQVHAGGGGTTLIHQTSGNFITEVAASKDSDNIALITNNTMGYQAEIYTIDFNGTIQQNILSGVSGAVGGLDLSLQGDYLLFVQDVSGYESSNSRRLNSRVMLYEFATGTTRDLSGDKPNGTNDLDPRFSPNEAQVIFVNTSNDEISRKDLYTLDLEFIAGPDEDPAINRSLLHQNAAMPDWE